MLGLNSVRSADAVRSPPRQRPRSVRADAEAALQRVYNEYRDGGLLGLWPEQEMLKPAQDQAVFEAVWSSPRPLREIADGRETVSSVLGKHLSGFERGYFTLSEAFSVVDRYENGEWRFKPGDVVEFRGIDFRWHLGLIVKEEDMKYSIVSPGGVVLGFGEQNLDLPQPRPCTKMLRAVFGPTPFRWQQQALLDAEAIMVHRKSSPDDFQARLWKAWASERYEKWLADDENAAFRKYHASLQEGARHALKQLVLEPFLLMDQINNEWEIESEKLSPYFYLACLGSGAFACLVCLTIQLGTATALFLYNARIDEEEDRKHWARDEHVALPCHPGSNSGNVISTVMISIVMLWYIVKVVPDQLLEVMSVIGAAKSGAARLTALRHLVRISDEDSIKMKIGLRLHETVNSAFDCILYMLNVYLLFSTRSAVEILLNVLAVEWIRGIDESFCASGWWDPNQRYIKASAVEMVIRQFLDIKALERKIGDTLVNKRVSVVRQYSTTNMTPFCEKNLDAEVKNYYGEDLKRGPSVTSFAGFNSGLLLGRYKFHVFRRWGKYRDLAFWRKESFDFDAETHRVQVDHLFRVTQLVYGDVPGFPYVLNKKSAQSRYKIVKYFFKYSGTRMLLSILSGYQLYCAVIDANPHSGFKYDREISLARSVYNILDALVEFGAIWVVFAFPFVILAAVVYVPLCY